MIGRTHSASTLLAAPLSLSPVEESRPDDRALTAVLWAVVFAIALAIAVIAWFGISAEREQYRLSARIDALEQRVRVLQDQATAHPVQSTTGAPTAPPVAQNPVDAALPGEPRRVEFEAAVLHTSELLPGVMLQVTRTDPDRQRFSGSIQFVPHSRGIPIENRSLRQPLQLHIGRNRRALSIFFTRVTKNSVLGYMTGPEIDASAN